MFTNVEIDEFIEKGFTFLRNAVPRDFINALWKPKEKFLAALEGFNEDSHLYFPVCTRWAVADISPEIDRAVSQLLGGDDKFPRPLSWGDGFVVARPVSPTSQSADGTAHWHKDGFHRHFLDSPEIGLVVIVMWTPVTNENGATAVAEGSLKLVADLLANHPEGVEADFFDEHQLLAEHETREVRLIGDSGDVCFMHPMLLHRLRRNTSSEFRAITNPFVQLVEPMQFRRYHARYSPVERAVLNALGVESIDFRAMGRRGKAVGTSMSRKLEIMRSEISRQISEYETKMTRNNVEAK